MTNFTTRMMIAAATLVVAAGAASAQTLKAEIPFAFRANGKVMAAGSYRVTINRVSTVTPYVQLNNYEENQVVLARAQAPHDPPKAWKAAGNPVLTFECGATMCSLAGVWGGEQAPAYKFSTPKPDKNEAPRVALVILRGNGD